MSFVPVANPDPTRIKRTNERLCALWGISGVRVHQEQAGINMVKGISTLLDVPTGGGKTLAFWWPLLYHWAPDDDTEETRKNLLVISPLVALMGEQANDLTKRRIPAMALTSQTPNLEDALTDCGLNKFRVVLISPEMAIGKSFHQKVLNSKPFQASNIGLIIDEAHAMDEWGTDDFRPAYNELATLLKRMPTGAPLMMGSATLPPLLRNSIVHKLGVASHYVHLGFSNEKTNIALSVRLFQHSLASYADLLPLFTKDAAGNPVFPQALIYVNSRREAEEIQDFLRRHAPEAIPAVAFEFYHRHIAESQKLSVQERIRDGSLLGVPTTDALGLGIDFPHIKRVVFYREHKTFLSYVQKAGRCVRLMSEDGEVIMFITRAAHAQHLVNLEAEGEDGDEDGDSALGFDVSDAVEGEQMDRDAAVEEPDDAEQEAVPVNGSLLAQTYSKLDRLHLSRFIVTSQCRWKVWNSYFENARKKPFFPPRISGARCCDNCDPDMFPVDIVSVVQLERDRPGRGSKPTEELTAAVVDRLRLWRATTISRDFPQQSFIPGKIILPNKVVEKIGERPRAVTTADIFFSSIEWKWGTHENCRYRREVVAVIGDILKDYPDEAQEKRDAAQRERAFNQFITAANKQRRERLTALFQECYDAVFSVTTGRMVSRGRGVTKRMEPERRCQIFLTLPRRTVRLITREILSELTTVFCRPTPTTT
ncbi:P-loop containing nucleoside triphosphate hydrolase protein [Mycena sanguinolenta]|nr:P-loop containing nucleoside triphosphate hydrolase protein [Mycena sanguinolenta]